MIFRLFLSSAVWYLKRLKQINTLIEKAKHNLDHNVNNESLIALSRLQDSLTYFVTSIRGNETLLAKLKFKLQVDELDADLIEDVNIEMSQARETTNIYSDHHQQQHEHRDAYAHIRVDHHDAPDANIIVLWNEPHKRYGRIAMGIPHSHLHISNNINAFVAYSAPQATVIEHIKT